MPGKTTEANRSPSPPLTIMGHVFDFWALPKDPKEVARVKADLGFNMEHWMGNSFEKGPDTGNTFLFRTKAGMLRDDLADYLPAAHDAGIRVFVYFNAHWYADGFPAEMFARKADGEIYTAYGHGGLTCPAGPFREWSAQIARDLGEYDIDGVFLDGPSAVACWCDGCRRLFREQFGVDLPDDLSKAPVKVRLQAQDYIVRRHNRFVQMFAEALRHRRDDIAIYFNGSGHGRPIRRHRAMAQGCDLVGAEGGFIGYSPLRGQFRYKTGATAKTLEAVSPEKPRVVFIDHAFKRYDYFPLTRAEVRLMFGGTIANGAWPWYLLYWANIDGRAAEAGREMNRFILEHGALLAKTTSAANVALMQSDATIEVPGIGESENADDIHRTGQTITSQTLGDHHAEFLGFYEALTRSQVPFDVVDDAIVAAGLADRYDLLVLPNCAAMSDEVAAGIRAFVKKGGRVIATFNTSALDELGRARKEPALADVLGIESLGDVYGPTTLDYLHVEPEGAMGKTLEAPLVPCPILSREIVPAKTAKVLARYYGRLSGRYVRLPALTERAAAVLHGFGKGRAIAIAGNLGEHYHAYVFDEHRRMIAGALRELIDPPARVEGGGEFLEISLRLSPAGEYLLHLLDHAAVERPYERVLPLRGLKFEMKLDATIASVRAARRGCDVSFEREGDIVRFTFDMENEYEMIVLSGQRHSRRGT